MYLLLVSLQIEGAGQTRTVLESVGTTEVCVTIRNAMANDSAAFNIQTITHQTNRKCWACGKNGVVRFQMYQL